MGPIVKSTHFSLQRQAMTISRYGHPAQDTKGLALFTIHHEGPTRAPLLYSPEAPLLQIEKGPTINLDLPSGLLPHVGDS